jgi:hypothetical protein
MRCAAVLGIVLLSGSTAYAVPADHYFLTATSPQTAGVPFSVTVTEKDAADTTIDESVNIAVIAGPGARFDADNNGIFTALDNDTIIHFSHGIAVVPALVDAPTTVTFFASSGPAYGESNPIVVSGGAPTSFTIDAIGSQTAGSAFPITIRAYQ